MKITVTSTSSSLHDILEAKYGQEVIQNISSKRIRGEGGSNYSVLMKNGPANKVYLTNILAASSVAEGFPIAPDEAVAMELTNLENLQLVTESGTQDVFLEIF